MYIIYVSDSTWLRDYCLKSLCITNQRSVKITYHWGMNRIFSCFVIFSFALSAQAFSPADSDRQLPLPESVPTMEVTSESYSTCPVDGYISASIADAAIADVEETGQPLSIFFTIHNDSETYSYAGVSVGVALYNNTNASDPSYWSPVADDVFLLPQQQQTFNVLLDATHVSAGQYEARIGVAQGDSLTAYAASQKGTGVPFEKSVPAVAYPFDLSLQSNSDVSIGDKASYQLVAENTSDAVLRDYTQHIVVARGDQPLGSAIISRVSAPVKMIPGKSETTRSATVVPTDGSYKAYAYSEKENTLLPVAVGGFNAGEETGPSDLYLPLVGVGGLRHTDEAFSVVSCVAAVSESTAEVVQLEQQYSNGGEVLSEVIEVAVGGAAEVRIPKSDLESFDLVTNVYSTIKSSEENAEEDHRGELFQTINQTIECDSECQTRTIAETIESFAAEDAVQSTFWFYLGIVLAAALLLYLMLHRLVPPEEDEHMEMHEPQ